MPERDRIVRQANKVTEDYLRRQSDEALGRLEMEMHGEGCGCRSCVVSAVHAVNSIIHFVSNGNEELEDEYSFGVEEDNGRLKVIRSKSWERNGKF